MTDELEKYRSDYVVYLHRNPITKEILYVGAGSPIRPKYIGHGRSIRWHEYVRNNGLPEIEIYKTGLSQTESIYLESCLIKTFGRTGYREGGILVNSSAGGLETNRGIFLSEESKKKMSKAKKGKKLSPEHLKNLHKFKSGKDHLLYGKEVSESTRLKMSIAKRGKLPACAKKVINIKTGEIYPSGAFVARMIGRNVSNFVAALNGYEGRPNYTDFRFL